MTREIWIGPVDMELIGLDVLRTPLMADETGVQPMEKLGFLTLEDLTVERED